jgi:hypothetical protein
LHVAGAEGALGWRLGRRPPTTDEVAAALALPLPVARRVARIQAANSARDRMVRTRMGRGPEAVRRLFEIDGKVPGGAAIIVSGPWGRVPTLAAVAGQRDDVLYLIDDPALWGERWAQRVASPGRNTSQAAAALKTAVDHLEAGGAVATPLVVDRHATTDAVPFFDGTLNIARGIGAMARRTGAPVVPVTVAWRRARRPLAVTIHPPLADDVLRRLGETFEGAARTCPEAVDPSLMAAIRHASRPPASTGATASR